jgi:uncharacterized phage-associated protein
MSIQQAERNAILGASTVADWFLCRARQAGAVLTPMKLLKLVYIAHGWYLAETDRPLFGEPVEAWRYGPVVRSLYERFSVHGSGPVTQRIHCPDVDDDVHRTMEIVWNEYGPISARDLSRMTHQQGTPWQRVFSDGANNVIAPTTIRDHFRELAERAKERVEKEVDV